MTKIPWKPHFSIKTLIFTLNLPISPPFPRNSYFLTTKNPPPLIFVLLNISYFLFPYKSSFLTYRVVEYLLSTIYHVSSLVLAVVYFIIYPRSFLLYYVLLFLSIYPYLSSLQLQTRTYFYFTSYFLVSYHPFFNSIYTYFFNIYIYYYY